MSKIKNSQAQTKKEQWCGQDNLSLQIGNFSTLTRWFDVDEHHHPVKDYIEVLKKALWDFPLNGCNLKIYNELKKLAKDLEEIDGNIDRLMKEGGPSCR